MKGEPYSYKDYMEDMIAHPEEFEGILSPTGGPRTVEEYFAGNTCGNNRDDDFMTGPPKIDFIQNK